MIVCGAMLLLLFIVLLVSITPTVKHRVEKRSSIALGVPVEIKDLQIRFLHGSAVFKDIRINSPTGFSSRPLFAIEKITAELNWFDFLRSRPLMIKKIYMQNLSVFYEVREGASNIEKLQKTATGKNRSRAVVPAIKKQTKLVVLKQFESNGGSLTYSGSFLDDSSREIELPIISLKDIGTPINGVTPNEVAYRILGNLFSDIGKAVTQVSMATPDYKPDNQPQDN